MDTITTPQIRQPSFAAPRPQPRKGSRWATVFIALLFSGVAMAAISIEESPVVAPRNTVTLWCEIGGTKVRYSNLSVPGYHECGAVNVVKSCDPAGQRFIGPESDAPYAFMDCGRGPRIVQRTGWLERFVDYARRSIF